MIVLVKRCEIKIIHMIEADFLSKLHLKRKKLKRKYVEKMVPFISRRWYKYVDLEKKKAEKQLLKKQK